MGIINRILSEIRFSRKEKKKDPPPVRRGFSASAATDYMMENLAAGNNIAGFSTGDTRGILTSLRNYSFLQTLVDSIRVPLIDVIKKSTWQVGIDPNLSGLDTAECSINGNKLTEILSRVNLLNFILGELSDWIIFGYSVYMINPDYTLNKIQADRVTLLYHRGQFVSALAEKGDKKTEPLSPNQIIPFVYDKVIVDSITEEEAIKGKMVNKSMTDLSPYVIEFEKVVGIGYLHSVADDLQALSLREAGYNYLSLLEIVQPKVISLAISPNQFNVAQAEMTAQNIEGQLNDAGASLLMAGGNIKSVLINSLSNRYQVFPMQSEMMQLEQMEILSLSDTIQQIREDIDEKKKYILNNRSIPEELYNGEGNRWEVIARTDRYLDILKFFASSIEEFIKEYCYNIMRSSGVNIKSSDSIIFSLDISQLTSNYIENSGLTTLSNKLEELEGIISAADNMADMDVIREEKLKSYVFNKVKEIDPALSELINYSDGPLSPDEQDRFEEIIDEMLEE